jgi:GTPase SAR1 family protein
MFQRLYNTVVDICLVEGVQIPQGWGEVVRQEVIPLLDHPKLRHHTDIIQERLDSFSRPISVFVVGEGKFGKSTLINALAGQGQEIAKTDFLPLTWYITRYTMNRQESCYRIYYDTSQATAEDLEKICSSYQGKLVEKGIFGFPKWEDLQEALNQEEAITKKMNKRSSLRQVIRTIPNATDATLLDIVDTPGISQIRFASASQETIEDFYSQADVVLWVMAADKLNSKETRHSLESMSRYNKPIIGVINRADNIPPNQKNVVISQAQEQYGKWLNEIVLVSAKNGFEALKSNDSEQWWESGLPALKEKIDALVGEQGYRTKAYSIYNTSAKAAEEAGQILTQEADVLESNIALCKLNKQSAESYIKRGGKVISRELGAAAAEIREEAARVMKKTANVDDNSVDLSNNTLYTNLFDVQAVKESIRQTAQRFTKQTSEALTVELAQVQDEISTREYQEQTYASDASIKAHLSKTSFSMATENIAQNLKLPAVEPKMSILERVLTGVVGLVGDAINGVLDLFREVSEAEKLQRRSRKRITYRQQALNAYLSGLEEVSNNCTQEIAQEALAGVESTAQILVGEVIDCFNKEFGSQEEARKTANLNREKAKRANVPPPVLYTATQILKSSLNGEI